MNRPALAHFVPGRASPRRAVFRLALVSSLVAMPTLMACESRLDGPQVQPAATADPGGNIVPITADGSYGVPCLIIEVGQTVEWRNEAPSVPTDITSLGEPVELYSPNLVAAGGHVATRQGPAGPVDYVWWRHTFTQRGVYEYYDSQRAQPGQKVVDPYYGTVTWVGVSADLNTGVVCVEEPGSGQCDWVCCTKAADCPTSQCCEPNGRRCLLTSPKAPVCQGTPALREFQCFADDDCGVGTVCAETTAQKDGHAVVTASHVCISP